MAGPDAIAACEQAVLREVAELEASLIRSGALIGIEHKFTVRQGELWPELREIIREQSTDLVVVGTHGRHGMGKLFFGSVAEEIFRQAGCPVLVFGPHSNQHCWIETPWRRRTFLLATDFGKASLHGLSQAIAVANHFEAKLVFLNVIPSSPRDRHALDERADSTELRQAAYEDSVKRLAELARKSKLDVSPECHVKFASENNISELIIETAEELRADLIIMGLHSSTRIGVMSHVSWTTAYDVVCHASSPLLTVSYSSRTIAKEEKAAEIPCRLCRIPI